MKKRQKPASNKNEQESNPTASRFPEYDKPKYGERVQSFAHRTASGRKRIAYVRDENGYIYRGEKQ